MADYSIYPAIGVARLGNSENADSFFLAPDAIGGLPKNCDANGNEIPGEFGGFRDNISGKIKRQAQKFQVCLAGSTTPIKIGDPLEGGTVESIEWTVHLANKKSEWYGFEEQKGNLLFGTANSYVAQGVELRNSTTIPADPGNGILDPIEPPDNRHELFIDPGPRKISGINQEVAIDRNPSNDYPTYPRQFPPDETPQGEVINKLGDLKTDSDGNLLVLGGKGNSQGQIPLDSYGGADTWYDDISDGSVTCTIITDKGSINVLGKAWVIVGPPDFAPELVNIASWDDSIFDVGVRSGRLLEGLYDEGSYSDPDLSINGFDKSFQVNYQRDILPIIKRIAGYQWVANVQSMSAFFSDFNDLDPENISPNADIIERRKEFFDYFQKPIPQEPITNGNYSTQFNLFVDPADPKIPKMPLNSGSNSVSNYNIKKFMALTRTQYFFLRQWAFGICTNVEPVYANVDSRNRASVGNVVGLPQCPGIEITWTTQNKVIYDDNDVYRIKQKDIDNAVGLTPSRDECEGGGCEPGDLTKRMAIPWQADFFNCTIQHVNFNTEDTNKYDPDDGFGGAPPSEWPRDTLIPKPPTYYAYWWPPQAPWDVLVGDHTEAAQAAAGDLSAGLQVNFMRGINSYSQMVNQGWSYLGFIRNQNANASGFYPYFVETERDNEMFQVVDVGVGNATQSEAIAQGIDNGTITNLDQVETLLSEREPDNETTMKVFSLVDISRQKEKKASRLRALNLEFVEDLFKEITIAASHRRRPPRSGSRVRF